MWTSIERLIFDLMKFQTSHLLACIFGAVTLVACSTGIDGDTFDFQRLVGRWVFDEHESAQFEEWQSADAQRFFGRGYVLELGDTTFIETLEIRRVNEVWTYMAKVSDGPSAEVVPFALVKQSESRVEFANAGNDFPKKIGYEFLSDSEMQVYLEGPRNGQNIRIMFDFARSE
jgi:hypothetical protein